MTNDAPGPHTWAGIDLSRHRHVFPFAGAVATTLIGAAYAFSVFVRPLEAEFGWHRAETTLAFSVAMCLFGVFTFVGGLLVDRLGPRLPLAVGALFMVASQWASARITTVPGLVVTYGVMLGTGIGLVYSAATVAPVSRWYPDSRARAVAVGVSIMGMGVGSALAAPAWSWSIHHFGWRDTYDANGWIMLVVLSLLVTIIRFPAPDLEFDTARGWTHSSADTRAPHARSRGVPHDPSHFTFRAALRSPYLWLMGALMFLSLFGGLMVIGQLAAVATEIQPAGKGLTVPAAALIVSVLALCNGLGRPGWGAIAGLIGPRASLVICPLVMAASMLIFSQTHGFSATVVAAMLTGFAYGGTLSLNPIMTTALFGSSYVGRIYGFVCLLGFAFGGLLAPVAGGAIRTATGSYTIAFQVAAALAVTSAVLAFFLLPPSRSGPLPSPRAPNP